MKVRKINDRDKVKNLWTKAFPEDEGPFADWYFEKIFPQYAYYGIEAGDELASMAAVADYRLYFGDRAWQGNFLQGVCTGREYRKRGYSSQIIAHILRQLHDQGQAISSLIAQGEALHAFYGRLGFGTYASYDICQVNQGQGMCEIYAYGQMTQELLEKMADRYASFTAGASGFAQRRREDFDLWVEATMKIGGGWLFLTQGGYALAYAEQGRLQSAETVFSGEADILAFAAGAKSLGLDGFRFRRPGEQNQGAMLRIVNLEKFLQGYPVKGDSLDLQVLDGILEENDGHFRITSQGGRARVSRLPGRGDVQADISLLATWAATGDPYGFFKKKPGLLLEEY